MKIKTNKSIIQLTISLIFVSCIPIISLVIKSYKGLHNKNYIISSTESSFNLNKLSGRKYTIPSPTIFNNLNYVKEYISQTLIYKERKLRLSILGGRFSNSATYKNDKKKKASELASISSHIKRLHRYENQARATINYSIDSLIQENSLISKIVFIIKEHPYNYTIYLHDNGYVIPNINFFINSDNFTKLNYFNSVSNNIFNNNYRLNKNNVNLNSISLYSEEATVNAKAISLGGSSLAAALIKKVSFNAKVVIFDSTINSYRYATTISKKKIPEYIIDNPNQKFESNKSKQEILNTNFFKSININTNTLSGTNSSLNRIKNILINNYLPSYFNKHTGVIARPRVFYNKIYQFNSNKSLYLPLIILPIVSIDTSLISIMHLVQLKITKIKQKMLAVNRNTATEYFSNRSQTIENKILVEMIKIDNIQVLNDFTTLNNRHLGSMKHEITVRSDIDENTRTQLNNIVRNTKNNLNLSHEFNTTRINHTYLVNENNINEWISDEKRMTNINNILNARNHSEIDPNVYEDINSINYFITITNNPNYIDKNTKVVLLDKLYKLKDNYTRAMNNLSVKINFVKNKNSMISDISLIQKRIDELDKVNNSSTYNSLHTAIAKDIDDARKLIVDDSIITLEDKPNLLLKIDNLDERFQKKLRITSDRLSLAEQTRIIREDDKLINQENRNQENINNDLVMLYNEITDSTNVANISELSRLKNTMLDKISKLKDKIKTLDFSTQKIKTDFENKCIDELFAFLKETTEKKEKELSVIQDTLARVKEVVETLSDK